MNSGYKVGDIVNDVLIGRDDVLFLAMGKQSVKENIEGKKQISDLALENFKKNIASRKLWSEQNNIFWSHIIFPDKQSVLASKWPFEIKQNLGQFFIEKNCDIFDIFYPKELLKDANDVFQLNDTHMSDFGMGYLTLNFIKYFGIGEVKEDFFDSLPRVKIKSSGDLGSKLIPEVFCERDIYQGYVGDFYSNSHIIKSGNNGIIDIYKNKNALNINKVLIFSDSFGRHMAKMFSYLYSDVFFFRTPYFHPEIANKIQPDILITGNVERYLNSVPSDIERFDMKGLQIEKGCTQDLNFMAALKNILD